MPSKPMPVVKTTLSYNNDDDDPLTRALAPPPNETAAEKAERLRAEAEARRISDLIDEELNRQRLAEKKGPKPVKILLLGQSESGKSTTLKNFQLMNSPKAFRAERSSWRAIIQLNVVRSIRIVLDAILEAHLEFSEASSAGNLSRKPVRPPITTEHLKIRMRLLPLLEIEETLTERLSPIVGSTHSIEAPPLYPPNKYTDRSPQFLESDSSLQVDSNDQKHQPLSNNTNLNIPARPRGKEVSVSAGSAWKTAFSKALPGRNEKRDEEGIDLNDPRDPGRILNSCGPDIIKLWTDPAVKALLDSQKLRLEELPGFFLDSLERVTALHYIPSDDDILRARLKTLGVTEYRFDMKAGNQVSHDWRVYDVGGQRSLRAAWVPFFDDMNAIIFLAPISCFDQVLAEDHSVNRLEDSVLLWKSIVQNPLLAKTNLVLFLNKCDVLRAKLRAGIRLGKYVISYGDRPNTFEHTAEYLRKKFASIHRDFSPEPRTFYCHLTSVTDTKQTAVILEHVTDMVLRANLRNTSII